MTNDVAIRRIQNHMKVHRIGEYPHELIAEALDMAINALREQEERQWITVTERLPDEPMMCLVYTKRGDCGGYDIAYYSKGFNLQYSNVTHWMPLPLEPEVKND